ncbi:type IV secretion system protein [Paucibacter sp. DJ2R-2]|uniref:type IV secretion system protein n=1 Tax=Paucibacter sp. DJ2R-2 TaxID=2893558 RepID=UPI0021E512D8|nr:type IV secretion system protein [Paucibacter sp. DJ2R-2]MCV2438583.1 type IV secretion system protein [Paucibacter sp. DJ2R-2]
MFTWVGNQLHAVLGTYVLGVVTALMTAITPLALTCMTVWVTLYGWAVLRNEVSESIPVFAWKVFKVGLVLAFALQSAFYIRHVSETAEALAYGVATTFLPSSSDPLTVTSPYSLLDTFNDQASQLVSDLFREVSLTRLDLLFAVVLTSIGNAVFLCIALYVVTLAKLFLAFVLAVGPLFILCLAWRPTARFFDSWLSMVLNAVVLTWFSFFALGLSLHMGQAMVHTIEDHGGFLGPSFNAVTESIRYCIVMVLMAIICFQAPNLASALTGGAAVQQGIQMIQNAMTASRGRSAPSASESGSAPGGVMRAGAGLPYAAGHRAANTGRTASAAVQELGDMARRGYGAVRSAAYKLAAQRGRS